MRNVPMMIVAGIAVVFVADLLTPRGVAVWLFYFIPLLATLWWPWRGSSKMVAAACAVLTILELNWTAEGIPFQLAIANRSIGVLVLGLMGLLIERLKRATFDRQASEARLRRVIDSNMVGMVFWDRDGNIEDGNEAFLQTVGYDREDLQAGRIDWRKMTPPEFRELDDQALREIAATGVCQSFEKEYLHKDGHRVPIIVAAASFEEDRTRGVAFILDNTKHKRLEQQLAARERRLQTILDSEPECVKVMAADGTLLEMNRAGLEMLDADSAGQVCGQCVDSLVTPEFRPAFQALTERVFRGESGTLEFEVVGLKGHHRWLETHATPLRDDAGQVTSLLSVTRDITDRKAAETALLESKRKLDSTINSVSGFVYRCGNQPDWPIEYVSEGVLDVLGYPAEEFMSGKRNAASTVVPSDRDRIWKEMQTALEARRPYVTEYRVQTTTGEEKWVWEKGAGVFDGDTLVALEGFVTDISDRKRVEEALQASEAQLTADLDAMIHLQKVGTLFVEREFLQPVLDEVLATAIAITNADMGNIQLLDAPSNCLRIVAQRGFEKPFLDFWNAVQEGEGACGTALLEGDRVLIEDVTRSPIFVGKPALDVMLEAGVRAVQSTLLRSRSGRLLGIFSTHFRTPRLPDEHSLRLLDLLARQAADILERAESEAALREADSRLRMAVSAANVGLWDWDLTTNKVYLSPEWKRQIGYDEHEISNDFSEWQSRVHPDDLEQALDIVRRYIADPWPNYVAEFRLRHKDGSYRWILTQASLQLGDDGQPVRMLGSHVDITEHKQAESALWESELRMRLVTDTARVGLVMVNHDRRYLFANATYGEILNLPAGDLIGRRVADVLAGVYEQQIRPRLDRAFAGERVTYELQLPTTEGNRWFAVAYEPRKIDDTVSHVVVVLVDITARKEAETALREREQQLRLFVEHSPAAIVMLDRDMRYLVASQRWLADYRLGSEPIIGRSHYELLPEISEHWKAIHRRCLAGAIEKCEEDPFPRADGTIDWVRWEIRPWHTAQGDVGGLIIFSELINERKQAEARLIESQQRLALATESAHTGIWDWDVVSNKLVWDGTMYELYGIRPQDFGGAYEAWEAGVHPDDRDRAAAETNAVLAGSGDYHTEFRVVWPNGEVRHLEAHGVVQRADNGTALRMLGTNWDITERKQMEKALQDSAASLAAAQERAKMGNWELDPSTQTGWWSHGMYRLFDRDAALGPPTFTEFLDFVHPDDRPQMIDSQKSLIESGQNGAGTFRSNPAHGVRRFFSYGIHCLRDEQGRTVLLAGTLQDITERQLADDELAESRNRLEILSRQLIATQESERRHLARELHDEIGQELTSIKLNLKTLESSLPAQTDLIHDTLAIAEQALQQVRGLALDLRPSMLDDIGLAPALRWCLDRQAHRSGFAPHFISEPPEITVSPEVAITCFRVAQESLTNIARHAQARNVRVEVRQYETAIDLQVQDDGIGFNVTAATNQATHGASLGLLGMRERAELVGGLIDIESNSATGTTIHARFPLKQENNGEQSGVSPMALTLSGMALATGDSGSTISGELPAASAVPLTKRVPLGVSPPVGLQTPGG